ncbi:hypothetical protein F5883DRAFT_144582 [Diaporthe sp. PMI_573]|nr:hypothetical protein F5883DRAFT_144582 [Diaporthaceae sp. PMI_573]
MECDSFLVGPAEYGEGAQVSFTVLKTWERIVVSLFISDAATAPGEASGDLTLVDQLIRLLAQYSSDDDANGGRALLEEAFSPIYEAAESIISESEAITGTATTGAGPDQRPSLHTVMYPKTSHYRLESTSLQTGLVLVPIHVRDAYYITWDDPDDLLHNGVKFQPSTSLPRYSTHRIRVVKEMVDRMGPVCLVTVDGLNQRFLCKAGREGLKAEGLELEIELLQKILRDTPSLEGGQSSSNCQVPRLKGFIEHPENGVIVGFLQEWVPSNYSLQDLASVGIDKLVVPRTLRENWARQIKRTIRTLHAIGVAWGDAEPSNVLIDLDGDAWIVDFGSGGNIEWGSREFLKAVRRDREQLAMILKLLDVET